MPTVRYSKFTGQWWEQASLEDLLADLADFLLQSGLGEADPWGEPADDLERLKEALLRALAARGHITPEELEAWEGGEASPERRRLEQMLDGLLRRLVEEGYLTLRPPGRVGDDLDVRGYAGEWGPSDERARFALTNKTVDFLGFKTLKDLLGSLGKSSAGRHETRFLATGVEASEDSRPYTFGDTLNLDVPGTLLRAIGRQGLAMPLALEAEDLLVHQAEYASSCATVLMLDCSHSMILYGEDRFTPAKRVALALAHLIRTQYPGDSLQVVLFHDEAEEIPFSRLARVTVGPYYTNTAAGLALARRLLSRQRKDMRQIVMVTDGKPSAVTLPDGRIYRNPAGLDPRILQRTFHEVLECRRAGILVNTFMLARDYDLVAFVKQVTALCHGKAYFTTPVSLGQYLLLDFMTRKIRRIH
jgi:Ca-activated chloride channel family protein